MPGVLLAVQLPEDVHRAVARVDVEDSVHVGAPVDGVPAEGWGGRSSEKQVTTICHIKADVASLFLQDNPRNGKESIHLLALISDHRQF